MPPLRGFPEAVMLLESPRRGRQMDSLGRELVAGSNPQATVEKEGWVVVSH